VKYRAFISYKSEDRPWAVKLARSLAERGINVFFDQERLEAGEPWPSQLRAALDESQHLVALYSVAATKTNTYAHAERWAFEKRTTPQKGSTILLLLDAEAPTEFEQLHAIGTLRNAGAFEQGIDALDELLWRTTVDQVANAITKDDETRPVGCFVLAAKRSDFEREVEFERKFRHRPSLEALVAQLGTDRETFLARYGERSGDWRPFGGDRSITSLLNAAKDRINGKLASSHDESITALQFRFEYPSDAFWEELENASVEVARWRDQLAIIVVDPFSLYVPDVPPLLERLCDLLPAGRAAVMVLGATAAPNINAELRTILRASSHRLHQMLCDPQLPLTHPLPLGGFNISEEQDIHRLLLMAVGGNHRISKRPAPREHLITMKPA